jgi:hypothetical protein
MADTETLTFEKVWQMFRETDKKFQETDRLIKETGRQLNGRAKKAEWIFEKTNRLLDRYGSPQQDLIKLVVLPNIGEEFYPLGYGFTRIGANVDYSTPQGKSLTEVDIMLENGDYVLAVDVGTKPKVENVREHIKRMEILRRYADEHQDKRKYLGAVAGAIMSDQVRDYALKTGFYVLEQSGDTVKLASSPEFWKPRTW